MKGVVSLFLGTFASKLLGVVREIVFAAIFGANNIAAAYRISQTGFYAPTHALVVETVGSSVVPVYKLRHSEGDLEAQSLIVVGTAFSMAVSLLLGILLYFFSRPIVSFIAPDADGRTIALAAVMLEICAIAAPFYVVANFFAYIESAHGKFSAIASRPSVLNIMSIAGVIVAWKLGTPLAIVYSILLGHIAFFVWTLAVSLRDGILKLEFVYDRAVYQRSLRIFLRAALPLIALPFLAQTYVIAGRIFASFMGTQVIPCIDYANFITDSAITLLSVPLGVATLASYGGLTAGEATGHINRVASQLMLLIFPPSIFLAMNSSDIVSLMYQRGAFNATATHNTSAIVMGLAIGLSTTTVAYYFQKALNSQLKNVESVIMMLIGTAASLATFYLFWRRLGPLALGLGSTAYGASQYFFGMVRLRIAGPQLRLLGWLLVPGSTYVALASVTAHVGTKLEHVAIECVLAAMVWSIGFWRIAPLRSVAEALLRAVSRRVRIPLRKRAKP